MCLTRLLLFTKIVEKILKRHQPSATAMMACHYSLNLDENTIYFRIRDNRAWHETHCITLKISPHMQSCTSTVNLPDSNWVSIVRILPNKERSQKTVTPAVHTPAHTVLTHTHTHPQATLPGFDN